jgi:hypothetical protein
MITELPLQAYVIKLIVEVTFMVSLIRWALLTNQGIKELKLSVQHN